MASKEDIKPIYAELQGYLSQAPKESPEKPNAVTYDQLVWTQYNIAIDELNKVSGENYDRFKIQPKITQQGSVFMGIIPYRSKLGGLISRLHAEYFSDEQPPFSGMPTTIISQSQQQSQSFQIELLLQIQSKIDEQLHKFEKGSKERTFLEKLKGSLSSVKNAVGMIALLTKMASEYGLTIEQLKELFQ